MKLRSSPSFRHLRLLDGDSEAVFLLRYSDLAPGCSWGELFGVEWHGLPLDLTVVDTSRAHHPHAGTVWM